MTVRTDRCHHLLATLAAMALMASACSEGAATEPVAAANGANDQAVEPPSETPSTEAPSNETPPTETGTERFTIEGDGGPTTTYVSSAMGGVRFEAPEESVVLLAGDHVIVTTQEQLEGGGSFGLATIGLTTMLGSGAPLDSAEAYLDAIRGAGVEVTATGTTIEVLGYELLGYETIGGDDELFLFAADRIGAPVQSGFGPSGKAIEFIADTPSGVLVASVSDPVAEAEPWLPVLGTLIDSFESTGRGLEAGLPPGQAIEPADGGEPPPPAEGSDEPDATPPLGEPFSEIEAGRYELLNFGLALSVDMPDGWFVQPNFPGVVVLTKEGSIGPGDRDLVWINDIRELAPIAGGPSRAGDALSVDDIETMLADPPDGLLIDDIERSVVSDPNGGTMPIVSFGVAVDTTSACTSDEPCDYAFITSYGFVKQLLSTSAQRVWFFPEHPSGPAAVIAQSNLNSDFLIEAEAVMASLELRG